MARVVGILAVAVDRVVLLLDARLRVFAAVRGGRRAADAAAADAAGPLVVSRRCVVGSGRVGAPRLAQRLDVAARGKVVLVLDGHHEQIAVLDVTGEIVALCLLLGSVVVAAPHLDLAGVRLLPLADVEVVDAEVEAVAVADAPLVIADLSGHRRSSCSCSRNRRCGGRGGRCGRLLLCVDTHAAGPHHDGQIGHLSEEARHKAQRGGDTAHAGVGRDRRLGAVLQLPALDDEVVEAVELEVHHEPRVDLVERLADLVIDSWHCRRGRRRRHVAVGEHHYAVLVYEIAGEVVAGLVLVVANADARERIVHV